MVHHLTARGGPALISATMAGPAIALETATRVSGDIDRFPDI